MSLFNKMFGRGIKQTRPEDSWAAFCSSVYEKLPASFFHLHADHFHLKQGNKELGVVRITKVAGVQSIEIRFAASTRATVSAMVALLATPHFRVLLYDEYDANKTDLQEQTKTLSLVPLGPVGKKEDLN